VALIFVFLVLSQTQSYIARPWIWCCIAWYACLHHIFHCTHCAYPQEDGQAELTWVAGYITRWFTCLLMVIHPSTNYACCQ